MIEIPAFDLTNALPWKGLVIHHSATADGKGNDWAAIRKFHMSYRLNGNAIPETEYLTLKAQGRALGVLPPWSDIGYHFGLERQEGAITALLGRKMSAVGGHAKGFNHTHLGLCIVGNFDKTPPDPLVWEAAVKFARAIMYTFKFDRRQVLGHRETFERMGVPVQKTCPGTLFSMDGFREAL